MECLPGKSLVRQDNNIQTAKQVLVPTENFSQTALDVIPGHRMGCRFFSDDPGKSRVIQLVRLGQYA
jgi:hypothetical protein